MNQHRRIPRGVRIAACLAALALCLSACQSPQGGDGAAKATVVPLPPTIPAEVSESTVALYFRYLDEPYLIAQMRTVTPEEGEDELKAILDELIAGPGENTEARSPLDGVAGLSIVGVRENGDSVEVTLSKQFRNPPKGLPANWESNTEMSNAVYLSRELFLQGIVNTITERQQCQVQFYVESDTNQRLMLSDIGRKPETGDQPVDPMTRQADVILTAGRAADAAMGYIQERNMDRLMNYIVGATTNAVPDKDEIAAALEAPGELRGFEVLGMTQVVSEDGQKASVCVYYNYASRDGINYDRLNRCLFLQRERGVWKIEWDSLKGLFSA